MDIPNRSQIIPQNYSTSGIVSSKVINLLGRSVNDLECRGDIRIDRNPIGGNIFYENPDMYHFKLYDPINRNPDVEGSVATIKMYWGTWTRASKYTYSRRALITDDAGGGNSALYKTVSLTSGFMNWVYIELKAPISPAQNAQYLDPLNKPYTLETKVITSTPVQWGQVQKIDAPNIGDNKNNQLLIGMVYVDTYGNIQQVEQCWRGGDMDDIASYYEGHFKLEAAGLGGNAASTALTTPLYNTNNASTGDPSHQYYPFGESTANQVIVSNGFYQISGNYPVVWNKANGFSVLDLSDDKFKNNLISIGLVINVRDPIYEEPIDDDVKFTYHIYGSTDDNPIKTNITIPRSTDSFIYSQIIGEVTTDANGAIIDINQVIHDDIYVSKYTNDFAGYATNAYSTTQEQVLIRPGWIHGPYNHMEVGYAVVTLPDANTEIPGGFSKLTPYNFLVYLDTAVDINTGLIDTGSTFYVVASDFRNTGGGHWCDFVQVRGRQKIPIGIAVYKCTNTSSNWELTDWIQQQYGPVTLHYWTACTVACSTSFHYTGIICDPYEAGCVTNTTTTAPCPAT